MIKPIVNHYRCFAADQRKSMDIYADSLRECFVKSEFHIRGYQPYSKLERFRDSALIMRYLRYLHYPWSVAGQRAEIHHVLDHGYAHLQPKFSSGKSCVTVHDLIPFLNWKGLIGGVSHSRPPRKPWLNIKSLSYLDRYDRVVAVSESTKSDLVEHMGLSPEKISVISPVIASHFQVLEGQQVIALSNKYNLDQNKKWLMVSGREFYKNHSTSLDVLNELLDETDEDFRLIKTGLPSSEFDALVAERGLTDKVTSVYLDDVAELVALYNLVDCLLFPSSYEGFGMPVAEALACGTPVVISNRGSLPEVAGDLAIKCQADNVKQLACAVQTAVHDQSYRSKVRDLGPIWAEKFGAEAVGGKLEHLYSGLLTI